LAPTRYNAHHAPVYAHLPPAARRPPTPPHFPYTTLFRSLRAQRQPAGVPLVHDSEDEQDESRPEQERYESAGGGQPRGLIALLLDRKSTRLNSSNSQISYAAFGLKKKIPLMTGNGTAEAL